MSDAENADRRFRVFCDVCDWHADASHPNTLVASAEAARHDDRNHDGDETADVEAVNVVLDGGEDETPAYECDHCGAGYYGKDAARGCCLVTDGGEDVWVDWTRCDCEPSEWGEDDE